MFVIMVMMAAAAFMFVIVVVMMSAAAFMFVIVVVMMSAAALMFVIMVMMAAAAFMFVIMVMMSAPAFMLVIVVMMPACTRFFLLHALCQAGQLRLQRIGAFHCLQDALAVDGIPVRRHNGSRGIARAQQRHTVIEFLRVHILRTGKHDTTCIFNLVVVKLAKVLHIHFALFGVHNSREGVQLQRSILHTLYGANDIAEFTDAGRLD